MVRVQREEIQSDQKGVRGVMARVRVRLYGEGIQTGGIRGGSHSDGRCGISRRSRDAAGGSSRSESFQEF